MHPWRHRTLWFLAGLDPLLASLPRIPLLSISRQELCVVGRSAVPDPIRRRNDAREFEAVPQRRTPGGFLTSGALVDGQGNVLGEEVTRGV
jgi:hypothetical protein